MSRPEGSQSNQRRRLLRAALLAFALFAAAWLFATRSSFRPTAFGYDFVAFYCGASVAASGADPYRVEPLRSCEHRNGRQFRSDSKLVVPAPLPGYAFALLEPFARLPYPVALLLWTALSIAAYAVCVVTLVRLTGLSPPIVVAATVLSLGYVSISLGQLVPIALAALSLAARAAERERWFAAAAWCALTAIEPQLALPAGLALFLSRPASRVPLALAACGLAVLSVITLGIATNVEYATRVLHAQVAAEIASSDQLSPLAIAYRVGLDPAAAASLGNLAYLLAAALGVAFAIAVERRNGSRAALLLIPPAIALLGMPYIHPHHLAAAIPAALLLAGKTEWKAPAIVAIFCLAIPWVASYDLTPLFPIAGLAVATLAAGLVAATPLRAVAAGCATFALMFGAQSLRVIPVPPPSSAYTTVGANDLAQSSWNVLVGASFRGDTTLLMIFAIPAWTALVALGFAALRALRAGLRPNAA